MITEESLLEIFKKLSKDIREDYYSDSNIENADQIDEVIAQKIKILILYLSSQCARESK